MAEQDSASEVDLYQVAEIVSSYDGFDPMMNHAARITGAKTLRPTMTSAAVEKMIASAIRAKIFPRWQRGELLFDDIELVGESRQWSSLATNIRAPASCWSIYAAKAPRDPLDTLVAIADRKAVFRSLGDAWALKRVGVILGTGSRFDTDLDRPAHPLARSSCPFCLVAGVRRISARRREMRRLI